MHLNIPVRYGANDYITHIEWNHVWEPHCRKTDAVAEIKSVHYACWNYCKYSLE